MAASKRQKFESSAEAIVREIREGNELLGEINSLKCKLSIKNVSELLRLRRGDNIEAASLLALMFGFDTVMWVMAAMHHVPKVFTRRKNKRATIVFEIVNSLCQGKHLSSSLVDEMVKFVEEFVPEFYVLEKQQTCFEKALTSLNGKDGLNYGSFIAPPVEDCLYCGMALTAPNQLSSCTLYTVNGPKPCTKLNLRCQGCKVSYGRSMTNHNAGNAFYYPNEIIRKDNLVEVTNVVYMEKKLYRWIPSLINHCFVSFEGFAVSYNEAYCKDIKCNFKSSVMGAGGEKTLQNQVTGFSNDFIDNDLLMDDDTVDADIEMICAADDMTESRSKEVLKQKCEKAHIPGELSQKSVAAAFWECELYNELVDMDLAANWCFTNEMVCSNLSGSKDAAAEYIVRSQITTSYSHKCYEGCQNKGCGKLYVLDGNWKLCYAHCMFPVQVEIVGYEGEINYPDVCPRNPEYQSAFCDRHSPLVKQKGVPTKLRKFLEYCKKKKKEPNEVLKEMDTKLLDVSEDNAAVYQGTRSFMAKNKDFVKECEEQEVVTCNKDTVGKRRLQKWSRGIFIIATAGGHIEYWQPLYKSESPTQVFVITIVWLYNKFKELSNAGMDNEEVCRTMKETVLAYDNMCHLNSLRAARKDLPLSPPFDKMWKNIKKVIDRLHLQNHRDPSCKITYNPDNIMSDSFNTMAAEQVNVWASRLKRIMVAMPYVHHMFFFHRMVKRRNNYTELCYKVGKQPIVPKSAKKWFQKA